MVVCCTLAELMPLSSLRTPRVTPHFRTVRVAVFCTAANVAVSVTRVLRRMRTVVTGKVASVAPAPGVKIDR